MLFGYFLLTLICPIDNILSSAQESSTCLPHPPIELQVEHGPLGLRLGEQLNILGFLHDKIGHARYIEASGEVQVGDYLTHLNAQPLGDVSLRQVVQMLSTTPFPQKLVFVPGDGRCFIPALPSLVNL